MLDEDDKEGIILGIRKVLWDIAKSLRILSKRPVDEELENFPE